MRLLERCFHTFIKNTYILFSNRCEISHSSIVNIIQCGYAYFGIVPRIELIVLISMEVDRLLEEV